MADGASSSRVPILQRPPGIKKLNESVWELYNSNSVPEVDIIFFHGLQLSDYKEAFWETWLSRDRRVVWPKDWLSERFPKARILSISYDSLAWNHRGQVDPYVITENLIHDMVQSHDVCAGQNCPVVLVGHSFGGLIIKQVVLGCIKKKEEYNRATHQLQIDRINRFLGNCKGVFYYSTPHSGSKLADYAKLIPLMNSHLVNLLTTLSIETARINSSFANARVNVGIKTHAIGEGLKTDYKGLSATVVEEASARHDTDDFYTAEDADHFDVCKARDTTCCVFRHLLTFVDDILDSNKTMVVEDGDQCHGLPDYPIELESRSRDIEQLLMTKAVVGISGMGGVGKTTLAKRVYNKISKQFDYACFVENVKGMSDLNDWLLCHFHRSGTRMDGARRQWSDFKGKKTLIIMDDVDSESQLAILPKLDHFGDGSHVIFTSRNEGIFKFYPDCGLYGVDFLKENEAKKLFCRHAFGNEEIPNYSMEGNHLQQNVEAMVKKCGGLPLTLEVFGRYLRNETDAKVWEETIDKINKAQPIDGDPNDRVWASLRVTYETLAKEEQDMFIEAGTYFFGDKLDIALATWSSTNGKTRWKNLVRRSLVQERLCKNMHEIDYKTVWVHEHLRDLAWKLAKDDIIFGTHEKAENLVDQLNSKEVTATATILKLKSRHWDRALQLERVVELKDLKYLDLDGVGHKGFRKNCPRKISLLRWKRRELQAMSRFPINLTPMNRLVVLELNNLNVPKGFSALGNLKTVCYMSLSGLGGLGYLPKNFGNLSTLQYLELEYLDVSELPESFGDLRSLIKLKIRSCQKLRRLPDAFGRHLESLKELAIYSCPLECLPHSFSQLSQLQQLSFLGCSGLKELGDSFGKLLALENLDLSCTGIGRLPQSFSQLSQLQQLSFLGCSGLKELGDSFGKLSALEGLDLSSTGIEILPRSFSQLSRLQRLSISDCSSLKELGDSFGKLLALEDLDLSDTGIEKLPQSFSQLSGLQRLSIKFCRSLKESGDSFGNLTALKYLNLQGTCIERLPAGFGLLSGLEELECEFDQARVLPDNFCSLTCLRVVSIVSASLERLPMDFGKLSKLQTLYIHAKKLEKLPDSFAELPCLEVLTVWATSSVRILTSLPQVLSLRTLRVSEVGKRDEPDCNDIVEKLPENFGKLSRLESLTIQGRSLESLPASVGSLSSLRTMDIECENLKVLPDSLGTLSSLDSLKIVARKLESLPENIGQLQSLKTLDLAVPSIRRLPESVNQLSSLREFSFDCEGHERMPDHFDHLPFSSLSLSLTGKGSNVFGAWSYFLRASTLPEGIGRLSYLEDLCLGFGNWESLPEELGNLSSLQKLRIYFCSELKSVPDSLGCLSSLRELRLEYCDNLKSLPISLGRPLAIPQGERRNEDEPSFQTTAVEGETRELTVYVSDCRFLDDMMMRRLGWVVHRSGWEMFYRRKQPDDHDNPLKLRYMVIFVFLIWKVYSTFRSK